MHDGDERSGPGDEGDLVDRPRRRWGRRLLLTSLALVLVLALWHWQAGRRARGGLAGEMAACRATGEPATADELNRWEGLRSGTGENAVPLIRAAGRSINSTSNAWTQAMASLNSPPLTDAEVAALEAVVRENGAALTLIDDAAAAGRIDWEPSYSSPVAQNLIAADLSEQRSLVNLLRAAALVAHHRGDDAEALRRVEQMLLLSRAIDHQPFLVHHLVALACGFVGMNTAVELAPGLRVGGDGGASREQVRALIALLLDERPLIDGQRRAWVGERVSQLDFPYTLLNSGGGAVAFGGINFNIPGMRFAMKPLVYDNAVAMSRYTTAMMRATASSPDLPSFNANLGDPVPEMKRSPGRYQLASSLIPSLGKAPQTYYRALADRRLTATCLAIRLYALDHDGRLPQALDELVPAYLPSVPLDPLASAAPIRYVSDRTDPQRPRVYSVGVNGTDDGGTEKDPKNPRRGVLDAVRHLQRQPREVDADAAGE